MMSLKDLTPHTMARIQSVNAEPGLARRLRDMGLQPGMSVQVVGQAPFKGPYIVQVHGATFALREEEAACIQVRPPSS